jgi:hypothetical protein
VPENEQVKLKPVLVTSGTLRQTTIFADVLGPTEVRRVRTGACSRVEILEPHELPHNFEEWEHDRKTAFREYRDSEKPHLLFSSLGGSTGWVGDPMSDEKAARWKDALQEPLDYDRVHGLGLHDDIGFCNECKVPYCDTHWSISTGGVRTCPEGHAKSLDPHWSP